MTILYKQNKDGSFNVWSCVAVGDKVITTYGKENGKMMFEEYTAEPKNIGKKNERNAEQQALFEVAAKYKKQVDRKGYAYTKESAQNTEKVGVQLAHDAAKVSHAKYLIFPADAQPKLDGVRCRISRDTIAFQGFIAYSRENTEYHIPRELIGDINKMMLLHPKVKHFDGEIYAHGWDLEDIVSMIKNEENPDRHLLKFYWYDICDSTKTWPERRDIIETSPLNEMGDDCKVVPLKSIRVNSWEEFDEAHDKWVEAKFEGAMYRSISEESFYECGHRSYFLIKHKKMHTEEFKVTGVKTDKRGHGKFVVETLPNVFVDVSWKTTHEKKQYLAEHPEEFIGKPLTVQFQKMTRKGSLQFPVGLVIRDYE